MDIDWTKVRETLKRIEGDLARAQSASEKLDAEIVSDWPEVERGQLEAAFPNWREEFGPDWSRDFLDKRVGHANYRWRRGTRKYRIAPEVLRGMGLEVKPAGPTGTRDSTD